MKDHDPVPDHDLIPDSPREVALEIASILVKGYLRHRKARRVEDAATPETPHEGRPHFPPGDSETCVDFSGPQSVHECDG